MAYLFLISFVLMIFMLFCFVCQCLSSIIISDMDKFIEEQIKKGISDKEILFISNIFKSVIMPFSLFRLAIFTLFYFININDEFQEKEDVKKPEWMPLFAEYIMAYYTLNNPISFTVLTIAGMLLSILSSIIQSILFTIMLCFKGVNKVKNFRKKRLSDAIFNVFINQMI